MAPLDWRGCWWERSREYPVPRLSVFALARRHRALVAAVGSAGAVAVPVARGGVLIASRAIRLRRLEEALGGQAGGSREARGLVVLAGKDLHDPAASAQAIAAHRQQTGWRGTVILIPDNGRDGDV